jgi:hypothetical protein
MSANSLRPKTVNSPIGGHPQGARDQQAAKKENNMKKPKAKKKPCSPSMISAQAPKANTPSSTIKARI